MANDTDAQFEKLLSEFELFPIPSQTYLELCRYPNRRYEEITSRLLAFFLQPKEEHGLTDLLLSSLLELIPLKIDAIDTSDIAVDLEVDASGKRLDILIQGRNFVIGIENKITAPLDNPLDKYKTLMIEQNKEFQGIVLSVNPIRSEDGINDMKGNDFINILYSSWFEKIKQNIGYFLVDGGNRYTIFLYDFMNTINNKESSLGRYPMSRFFLENYDRIDSLIDQFNKFKCDKDERYFERLSGYRESLNNSQEEWWIYGKDVLGVEIYFRSNDIDIDIGIESGFLPSSQSIFGSFRYRVTSWDKDSSTYITNKIVDALIKEYPHLNRENLVPHGNNCVSIWVETIELSGDSLDKHEDEDKKIIEKLKKLFNFINNFC
ncbi:MAG: hypothetical protein B0D92_07920 [Spirochaeta sp. LUC14_002_19_P3]|nr:MAG: hypothetical protein B0D92_07920 [Spirochaeta sp. LUC14_002_19_P3]